jgi:hypothetical protein
MRFFKLVFSLLLLSPALLAQQFLNGSLEPTDTGLHYCAGNDLDSFNAKVANIYATGTQSQIYVADDSCHLGLAFAGTHFVGLKYLGSATNILIFKLDRDLDTSVTYKLEFFYMYQNSAPSCPLRFGYSVNSTTADSFAGNVLAPPDTSWTRVTKYFKPLGTGRYFWIASDLPTTGTGGITYVDSFRMANIPDLHVSEVNENNSIHLYPNPFSTSTKLVMDDNVSMPCILNIYDITGRTIMQQTVINREFIINKEQLGRGLFFIKLNDKNNKLYRAKLIAE